MSTKWYGKAAHAVASKQIDLINDDIKVMLVTSAYTPNQDTHAVLGDVTGEASGEGYTAGGVSLANKTLTQDAGKNSWKWDADDVMWPLATVTFRYAVLYDDSDPAKALIGYADFGSDQTATSQDLTIKWEHREQDPISGGTTTTTGILELGY